ncbi:MAG: hypothetical protein HYY17_00780 [Planctomycetes bacterium]|nr:hypothetical protein [Planctomycetota bacterium]
MTMTAGRSRMGRLAAIGFVSLLLVGGCDGDGDDDQPPAPPPVPTGFNQARGFSGPVDLIALAADGTGDVYVAGGFLTYNSTRRDRIARFNADETLDLGFAVGSGFTNTVWSITPAGDGSGDIYVRGDFTSYNGTATNYIVRLNYDGTVDAGFAVGSGFNSGVNSIATAGDGSGDIYVGGNFTSYNGTATNYIVRLNSDGAVDAGFTIGSGFNSIVWPITPAEDGSGDIYVGGYFTSYNGAATDYIVRLNSDGTLDADFAIGSGFNTSVWSITPAEDGSGDIYVGGFFTSYNGTATNFIARLNSDGTLDAGFGVGFGFNNWVRSIAPAGDGSGDIYVGGGFTSYDTTTVDRLTRLGAGGGVE